MGRRMSCSKMWDAAMVSDGVRTTRSCVRLGDSVRVGVSAHVRCSDYIDSNTAKIEAFDFDLVSRIHSR